MESWPPAQLEIRNKEPDETVAIGADPAPAPAPAPTPIWIIKVEFKASMNGNLPKPQYFWELAELAGVKGMQRPLYYFGYFDRQGSNPDQTTQEPYFIPEGIWKKYGGQNKKRDSSGGIGVSITGAHRIDGEKVPMPVVVKDANDLHERLKDGQALTAEAIAFLEKEGTKFEWHEDQSVQSFSFGSPYLPLGGKYIRLHSTDVEKMNKAGAKERMDEVYMPRELVDYWAATRIKHPDGKIEDVFGAETAEEETVEHNIALEAVDKGKFWVRNGDGEGIVFKTNVPDGPRDWQTRRKNGIDYIEGEGGWNRMINPALELFFVPIDSNNFEQLVLDAAEAKNRKQDCKQVYEVFETIEGLEAKAAKLECKVKKIAVCPFNHYETWIRTSEYVKQLEARPDRQAPTTEDEIERVKGLVPEQEDRSAKYYRKFSEGRATQDQGDCIMTSVTDAKIAAARGKRTQSLTQQRAMGVSATVIAENLGWKIDQSNDDGDGWRLTGVAAAEWLHRCAFSWGGLGMADTSQLRENMVFGSSECNSVMTRYEKAWQSLIHKESRRRNASKGGFLTSEARKGQYIVRSVAGDTSTQPPVCNVPWLCYVMEYKLWVGGCDPLEPYPGYFETKFYPFQRGFFTVLEQELDSVILERLYSKFEEPGEPNVGNPAAMDLELAGEAGEPRQNNLVADRG